jgi:hypothetical protein
VAREVHLLLQVETEKCIVVKVCRLNPLVLAVKVGQRQTKALGNEEGKVTGSGVLAYACCFSV